MGRSLQSVVYWFQFALPRGERRGAVNDASNEAEFQFALPRGERLGGAALFDGDDLFQFALPRGERPASRCGRWSWCGVSIRAPARGATQEQYYQKKALVVSIRAPARGATAIIGWQVLSGLSQRRAPACQKGTG